ncbi:hypothetical protein GJ496_009525 [Pomphorhynchus laevis]|nr:hypothetical protein GJ496_009525 [Pomphorhynchus laevis]
MDKRCKCCSEMKNSQFLSGTTTGMRYSTDGEYTCKSKNIVYLCECTRCHQQYVGETSKQINVRSNNRRADIKKTRIGRDVTDAQRKVLSLGLKFILTPTEFNRMQLLNNLRSMTRGIFAPLEDESLRNVGRKMLLKNNLIQKYVDMLPNTHTKCNISFESKKAVEELAKNRDVVIRPADKEVTDAQRKVLSLGLKFILTPTEFNRMQLLNNLRSMTRGIFAPLEDESLRNVGRKMLLKNNLIQKYVDMLPNTHTKCNISFESKKAVEELAKNRDVVIRPADKEGKVVIWDRKMYISEGIRQVETDSYKKITVKENVNIIKNVTNMISKHFEKEERRRILVDKPNPEHMYLLTKIHKQKNAMPRQTNCQ